MSVTASHWTVNTKTAKNDFPKIIVCISIVLKAEYNKQFSTGQYSAVKRDRSLFIVTPVLSVTS
jgi:hypothetical protein